MHIYIYILAQMHIYPQITQVVDNTNLRVKSWVLICIWNVQCL